jgi:hypothetical protein
LTLQILLLKCEGHRFPRNPNANPFELHCETLFYGPLVVAMNSKDQPYSLSGFALEDFELLKGLNSELERVQPNPMDLTNYKKCVPEYHLNSPLLNLDLTEESTKLHFIIDYFNKNCPKRDSLNMASMTVHLEILMNQIDKESFYMYRFKTEM